MKIRLCIALVIITSASTLGKPYNFAWKTSIEEVQKIHRLDAFEIEGLQENLRKFLGKTESPKFQFYVVDEMKKQTYCDVGMFSAMGFYKDSLLFYFVATEEMPYSKENKTGDCLQLTLFGRKDSLLLWKPIFKATSKDGDIFGEGGAYGFGHVGDDYVVELMSLGIISQPKHLQYTMFFFDKSFLDDVMQNRMKIHKDQKQVLHPVMLPV